MKYLHAVLKLMALISSDGFIKQYVYICMTIITLNIKHKGTFNNLAII